MNIEAWQLYLKGEYWRLRFTPESAAKAKEYFEQALAIDPNYAPAYSGLAKYYYILAVLVIRPPGEMAPLAKSAARKALALDPSDSESHNTLAVMAAAFDYDWRLAETHHRKAIADEPISPRARYCYAMYGLLPWGKMPEAIEQSRLALESDPLSVLLHFGVTWCLCCAKQYPESIDCARRALEIDPNYYMVWIALGFAQLNAGLPEEAVASFGRVVELAPWWHAGGACQAAALYRAGDHARNRELARQLADAHRDTFCAAVYYADAGEVDEMFTALEGAYRQRDVFLISIQRFPFFDPYRSDPRFQSLLLRMNMA